MAVNKSLLEKMHAGGFITLTEAQELLGTTRPKMSDLIEARKLNPVINELDKRVKFVKRSEVEALLRPHSKSGIPPDDKPPDKT